MPPTFALNGVYNTDPCRRLLRAATVRRVDIAGINNSEGLFGGHGYDHAEQLVFARRFGLYGQGIVTAASSDGGSSAAGMGLFVSGANNVTGAVSGGVVTNARTNLASAPAALKANLDQTNTPNTAGGSIGYSPMEYVHVPSGSTETGFAGINWGNACLSVPIAEALEFDFWRGQWGASGASGTFTPLVRRDESPFTVVNAGTAQASTGGTLGVMQQVTLTVAADAGRASWGRMAAFAFNGGAGRNVTGPAFITGMRMTRTNKLNGVARSCIYSAGSRTILSMWHWATLMPSTSWAHIFTMLCAKQNQALADQMLLVTIDEGTNQASETRFGTGAPNQTTANAAENFVFYMRGITAKIRAEWLASGRNPNNLAFNVRCTHGTTVGNNATLIAYRAALLAGLDFAGVDKDTTLVDAELVRPQTVMTADGDFADTVHLTQAGYERCAADYWQAITDTPTRKTLPQAGSAVLYVWDRSNPAYPWTYHRNVAQIVRPNPLPGQSTTAAQFVAHTIAGIQNGATFGANANRWALFVQNLTDAAWGPMGVQSKGLDPLSPTTITPSQASFFVANGIPATMAWVREVLLLLKAELVARNIPMPALYIDDDEEAIGFGSKAGATWVAGKLVGTGGSYWSPSLANALASDPTASVVPFRSMSKLNADRTADGVTFNDTLDEFNAANQGMYNFVRKYNRQGWLKHLALGQVVREVFPGITFVSYDESCAALAAPVEMSNAKWAHASCLELYGDAHSPVLYPPNPGDPGHAAQIGTLGAQTYYREWVMEQRRRIAIGPRGNVRCMPWLFVPGETYTYPGAGSAAYTPTVADQAFLIQQMASRYGDREFLLWSSAMDTTKARAVTDLAGFVNKVLPRNERSEART